ncbi:Phosphoglucomutase [Candidatus Providencia siddallii]|uniref:Phosphoglucomutase n=1 Tax=Candidatus Providencia siddallii TaxID=1715285 RepID=A0A0M6W6Y2_9GAMM|nr:Phosphoglucomutase [Candidatus Providencia siddallii]
MKIHKNAGNLPIQSDLINIAELTAKYYIQQPDPNNYTQLIKFGTSGHRGISSNKNFNENHIIAIAQSIAELRKNHNIRGPCYIGKDTHALSEAAFITIIEVLTANKIYVIIQKNNGFTPTPVISYMILNHNKNNSNIADGIIITASHNPPEYGGVKYNYINGGPANIYITSIIEYNANKILTNNINKIKRINFNRALTSKYVIEKNFISNYVANLNQVINIKAISDSKLKIAVDPLGGSGIEYWKKIADYHQLNIKILNDQIDQTFRFIPLDYDGVIRIDCSSRWSTTNLLNIKEKFDLILTNDPDHDRHGIITPDGLMDSNHYLAVAIDYLFRNRTKWSKNLAIGKTLVSSKIIDFIVNDMKRKLIETSIGFKWFSNGLFNGNLGFCGEESAGASFLKFDGTPWSTDKDGIISCLLAAEITAVTGENPQQNYNKLAKKFGSSIYKRIQLKTNNKKILKLNNLSSNLITTNIFAGNKIKKILTRAPYKNADIGGFKIITNQGWFAARKSGTENTYKIYCESFKGKKHLNLIEKEGFKIIKILFN